MRVVGSGPGRVERTAGLGGRIVGRRDSVTTGHIGCLRERALWPAEGQVLELRMEEEPLWCVLYRCVGGPTKGD